MGVDRGPHDLDGRGVLAGREYPRAERLELGRTSQGAFPPAHGHGTADACTPRHSTHRVAGGATISRLPRTGWVARRCRRWIAFRTSVLDVGLIGLRSSASHVVHPS